MGNSSKVSYLPAVTVFTGSFLLFLMQPVMGRTLLPFFGGSAAVWMICLASWQTLLLVGYAYAHFFNRLSSRNRPRHFVLLFISALLLFALSFFRADILRFIHVSSGGVVGVFLSILLFASFPYILLASGSTLVQAWIADKSKGRDVYHLYAVSNAGSFCGLLCYPFLIEPFVPVGFQWYAMVLLLLAYCVLFRKLFSYCSREDQPIEQFSSTDRKNVQGWSWFVLPALSCFLLNAIVAHMFIDITPMPLIWVVLVACFLLSYVVGFSRVGGVLPGVWFALALISIIAAAVARRVVGSGSFAVNGASAMAVLFFCGTWLHRKLYENRPEPARLTRYYFVLTAGGAVGGILASVAAPLLFKSVFEYPLALWLCAVTLVYIFLNGISFVKKHAYLLNVLLIVWAVLVFGFIRISGRHTGSRVLYTERNFYGTLRITQTRENFGEKHTYPVNYLWNGQTTHGIQVRNSQMHSLAKSYYGETGGGIAVKAHPRYKEGKPMTVGVVGLGAGTMACYGRPGDLYRFYEINPAVVKVATDRQYFSYLADSQAAVDLIDGDARNMLAVEQAAGDPLYDSLIIDAFSGDAVPYHLATEEAFRLYFSRLKPDGILAMHVSNWHINLLPLCKAVARELNVEPYGVVGVSENKLTTSSIWVFMTRKPMTWRYPMWNKVREVEWSRVRDMKLPEDDCGSLISLIRWH